MYNPVEILSNTTFAYPNSALFIFIELLVIFIKSLIIIILLKTQDHNIVLPVR